eukprot:TRINITY_DN30166_c0_g1_i3.p1 TRINITY_DN30166_c0_g1~~TRINITY_DN30166_c0_g1_i3.p1  ORF type:complete len:1402 (-),score=252.33 TRINITY_DN30166_c0_g1_i3:392-4597(-)
MLNSPVGQFSPVTLTNSSPYGTQRAPGYSAILAPTSPQYFASPDAGVRIENYVPHVLEPQIRVASPARSGWMRAHTSPVEGTASQAPTSPLPRSLLNRIDDMANLMEKEMLNRLEELRQPPAGTTCHRTLFRSAADGRKDGRPQRHRARESRARDQSKHKANEMHGSHPSKLGNTDSACNGKQAFLRSQNIHIDDCDALPASGRSHDQKAGVESEAAEPSDEVCRGYVDAENGCESKRTLAVDLSALPSEVQRKESYLEELAAKLKSQIEAAREAEEDHNTLRASYRDRIAKLEIERKSLADASVADRAKDMLRSRVAELEHQLTASTVRISELEQKLACSSASEAAARARAEEASERAKTWEESRRRHAEQIAALQAQRAKLEQQAMSVRSNPSLTARSRADCEDLERLLASSRTLCEKQAYQLATCQAEKLALEEELVRLRASVTSAQAAVEQTCHKDTIIKDLRQELDEFRARCEMAQASETRAVQHLAEEQQLTKQLREQVSRAEAAADAAKTCRHDGNGADHYCGTLPKHAALESASTNRLVSFREMPSFREGEEEQQLTQQLREQVNGAEVTDDAAKTCRHDSNGADRDCGTLPKHAALESALSNDLVSCREVEEEQQLTQQLREQVNGAEVTDDAAKTCRHDSNGADRDCGTLPKHAALESASSNELVNFLQTDEEQQLTQLGRDEVFHAGAEMNVASQQQIDEVMSISSHDSLQAPANVNLESGNKSSPRKSCFDESVFKVHNEETESSHHGDVIASGVRARWNSGSNIEDDMCKSTGLQAAKATSVRNRIASMLGIDSDGIDGSESESNSESSAESKSESCSQEEAAPRKTDATGYSIRVNNEVIEFNSNKEANDAQEDNVIDAVGSSGDRVAELEGNDEGQTRGGLPEMEVLESCGSEQEKDNKSDDNTAMQSVEADFPLETFLAAPILRTEHDPFIRDCREAVVESGRLLRAIATARADAFEHQMANASDGVVPFDSHENSKSIDKDLDGAKARLSECAERVEDLVEEADMQCHLTSEEREQVVERLNLELELLYVEQQENDQRTLKRKQKRSLPEDVRKQLSSLPLDGATWDHPWSPAHWAAKHGRRDVLAYIALRGGLSLMQAYDDRGRAPIHYASRLQDVGPILTFWLRYVLDVKAPMHERCSARRTTVWEGAEGWSRDLLIQLEMHGWQEAVWADGNTLLHWAAAEGKRDLILYLTSDLEADVSAESDAGLKPIDCARRYNFQDCVDLLLQQEQIEHQSSSSDASDSSDSDDSSSDSEHIEELAIPGAYLEVMRNIDEAGWGGVHWSRGYSLLHWAAKNDFAELCARFMYQKADPETVDESGKDAFAYARAFESSKALEQLLRGAPAALPPMPAYVADARPRSSACVEASAIELSESESSDAMCTE